MPTSEMQISNEQSITQPQGTRKDRNKTQENNRRTLMTSTLPMGKQSTATERLTEDPRIRRAHIQLCLSQILQEATMAGCPRLWERHRSSGYHDTGVILPDSPFQRPLQPKTPELCKLSVGGGGGEGAFGQKQPKLMDGSHIAVGSTQPLLELAEECFHCYVPRDFGLIILQHGARVLGIQVTLISGKCESQAPFRAAVLNS